jgi:hypothetical protein
MRSISPKRRKRMEAVREYRRRLIQDTGLCMICGNSPKVRRYGVADMNLLCCHEILNGPDRDKVLDEPSCLLVLCWGCNQYEVTDKTRWPLSRQLAVLKQKAPERYNRERVMWLRNPNAPDFVTEHEVDQWTT